MDFLDLDTPEGGIYICSVLLLFLGACMALPLYLISERKRQASDDTQGPMMPWWAVIVFIVPHLMPFLPGSNKWIARKWLSYPLIGLALLLGSVIAMLAFAGLIASIVRLIVG